MLDIQDVLKRHANWLKDPNGLDSERANLTNAKLDGMKLAGVNLSQAIMINCSLSYSDLFMANLSKTNLSGANLSNATLTHSYLYQANLFNTELGNFSIVPEVGEFIVFKRLNDKVIAKLLVCHDSKRIGGLLNRKCRISVAKVLELIGTKDKIVHYRYKGIQFHVNETYELNGHVKSEHFDDNIAVESSDNSGIAVYLTHEEAKRY